MRDREESPGADQVTVREHLTELDEAVRGGLPEAAAKGYQAVPFYALGFAAIEAPFAAAPDGGVRDQADTHAVLAGLPAADYPHIAATVDHLYWPDLTGQFDHGLRLLLAGMRTQLPDADDQAARRADDGRRCRADG